jgi:hypothetical protein
VTGPVTAADTGEGFAPERALVEVTGSRADWMAASEPFGYVASELARIELGPPLWSRR